MDHDWRDIENTVWVQDVPRRPSPIPHQPKGDDFPSTFESVLYAINVAPAIASLLSTGVRRPRTCSHPRGADMVTMVFLKHPSIPLNTVRPGVLRTRWDFSRVRTTLIPSIAGKHEGWPAVIKSGHTALMRAVSRLNPQQRAVSLEYQVRLEMRSEAAPSHIPRLNRGRQLGRTVPLGSMNSSSLGKGLAPRHCLTPPSPVVWQRQIHYPTR
jgi:hypothetical protein